MHIEHKAASRRAPVLYDQAQLLAMLTRDLLRAYRSRPEMDLSEFFQIPEYRKFVVGAYACGFVCRDFSLMDGAKFELIKARPVEHLISAPFRVLRHWVHMLIRAERWADGYASHVREAIDTGALEVVATRLESDQSLLEQEVIEEISEQR